MPEDAHEGQGDVAFAIGKLLSGIADSPLGDVQRRRRPENPDNKTKPRTSKAGSSTSKKKVAQIQKPPSAIALKQQKVAFASRYLRDAFADNIMDFGLYMTTIQCITENRDIPFEALVWEVGTSEIETVCMLRKARREKHRHAEYFHAALDLWECVDSPISVRLKNKLMLKRTANAGTCVDQGAVGTLLGRAVDAGIGGGAGGNAVLSPSSQDSSKRKNSDRAKAKQAPTYGEEEEAVLKDNYWPHNVAKDGPKFIEYEDPLRIDAMHFANLSERFAVRETCFQPVEESDDEEVAATANKKKEKPRTAIVFSGIGGNDKAPQTASDFQAVEAGYLSTEAWIREKMIKEAVGLPGRFTVKQTDVVDGNGEVVTNWVICNEDAWEQGEQKLGVAVKKFTKLNFDDPRNAGKSLEELEQQYEEDAKRKLAGSGTGEDAGFRKFADEHIELSYSLPPEAAASVSDFGFEQMFWRCIEDGRSDLTSDEAACILLLEIDDHIHNDNHEVVLSVEDDNIDKHDSSEEGGRARAGCTLDDILNELHSRAETGALPTDDAELVLPWIRDPRILDEQNRRAEEIRESWCSSSKTALRRRCSAKLSERVPRVFNNASSAAGGSALPHAQPMEIEGENGKGAGSYHGRSHHVAACVVEKFLKKRMKFRHTLRGINELRRQGLLDIDTSGTSRNNALKLHATVRGSHYVLHGPGGSATVVRDHKGNVQKAGSEIMKTLKRIAFVAGGGKMDTPADSTGVDEGNSNFLRVQDQHVRT
eukprot:g8844.t1